jgi:hypothetical protein
MRASSFRKNALPVIATMAAWGAFAAEADGLAAHTVGSDQAKNLPSPMRLSPRRLVLRCNQMTLKRDPSVDSLHPQCSAARGAKRNATEFMQ